MASSPVKDPKKNMLADPSDNSNFIPITVPKGEDGKYQYWAPPMKPCDCGTPDEGRHIRYKWPCAYYRKDENDRNEYGGRGKGKGKGKQKGGGRGKGKKGEHSANLTEAQFNVAVAAIKAASSSTSDTASVADSSDKESVISSATKSSSTTRQSCAIAEYDGDEQLQHAHLAARSPHGQHLDHVLVVRVAKNAEVHVDSGACARVVASGGS